MDNRIGVWAAGAVVCAGVVAAVVVPALVGLDQSAVDLDRVLQAPSMSHPLGTDAVGRDELLRCIYGMRVSLLVGLLAAVSSCVVGAVIGMVAAAWGGIVDQVLTRALDAMSAVPQLLLGILVVSIFRPGLIPVMSSIAATHWMVTARIVRAEVASLRERPFVAAAITLGGGRGHVVRRHFVPNIAPHVVIATTLMIPHAIWHESALSFLGLGLPPHLASLGTMMEEGRRALSSSAWWVSLSPGAFIVLPTLAIAVLANAARNQLFQVESHTERLW
jgi:peptide/nickel transport system permease protein